MRPGRSLFIAAFLVFLLACVAFFVPGAALFWRILVLVPIVFIIADGLFLVFRVDRLVIERNIAQSLAVGVPAEVEIVVSKRGAEKITGTISLSDIYDDSFDCNAFPARIPAPKDGEKIRFCYEVLPAERGDWTFPACVTLISSPLCFWRLEVRHETTSSGRTYPDFGRLASSGDLRAVLEEAGRQSVRKRGTGLEFNCLRDWQSGDTMRSIDWRATGRRGRIIVREYIEEQDQQVLFLLDSGYRLHRQEGGGPVIRTQFDSALDAVLLLSWVALKHGDAVACSLFGNEDRWVPPRRGPGALPFIMNAIYDAKSAPCSSSIFGALENAVGRLKRRTFIVVVSNFREEDEEQLERVLAYAGKRHLLLLVNIMEPEVEDCVRLGENPEISKEDALISASAFAYLAGRRNLMRRREARGFLTLESTAASLSPKLINSYLSVKKAGTL